MLSDGLISASRATYDADRERVNFSTLKLFARSAAAYRYGRDNPSTDENDAMRGGSGTHIAVLEPGRFSRDVVAWRGRRQGKAWDAFEAQHAGRVVLPGEAYDGVVAMAAAVRAHPDAARLLAGGKPEVMACWTLPDGTRCKGRIDWISASGAIVDLKSTRTAQPEAFGRLAWNAHYHAQGAWYVDGIHAITGERLPYQIVAVENDPPYTVQVFRLDEATLAAGRRTYRGWLAQLAECRRTNTWPGYASGVVDLPIPRWADTAGDDAPTSDEPGEEPAHAA